MVPLVSLRPVWIVQCTRSGNFLGSDLELHQSMKRAGRIYDAGEAKDTAVCQLGWDYEIHQFWEGFSDD